MTRYLVEELTEKEVMAIEKEPVANASVTRWRHDGTGLAAVCYNDCAHLAGTGTPAPTAPRRAAGRGAS